MNEHSNTRAGGDRGGDTRISSALAPIGTVGAPASSRGALATRLHSDSEANRSRPGSSLLSSRGQEGVGAVGLPSRSDSESFSDTRQSPHPNSSVPPEWIELIPAGSFEGRDGRGPYHLQDPAAVIAATMALRMKGGIPVDYDHATDLAAPDGRPAPAAGWIAELAIRNGAIWGRVEWTERAAAAIRLREYRYISPVFQYSHNDGAITRLLRAGLTNNPNLYLTAISAVGDEDGKMDEFLNQLREMLGLSPDASSDEILGRVGEVMAAQNQADGDGEGGADAAHSANAPDPAHYVAVAEFQKALTELNSLKSERSREKAEHAVDEAIRSGKLVPAQREWAVAYCAADPRGFAAFTARQPVVLAGELNLGGDPRTAIASRAHAAHMLSATETVICSLLGVSPTDFAERKSGRADFLRLNKENPEQGV